MAQRARRALIATLVALHATLFAAAPALHALPGFGHDAPLGCADVVGHFKHHANASLIQADDCPVCHLLSHSTLAPDNATFAPLAQAADARWEPADVVFHTVERPAHLSRGPPA